MVGGGKLDRSITVQSFAESRDDFGGVSKTWSTYATRRANVHIRVGRGNEGYDAQRKVSRQTVLFTVRRDSTTKDIDTTMRVQYNGKVYDIEAVEELHAEYRRMYMRIEAIEDVDNLG
jgi:SPP1 family predicted phage head-tail adaptor